MHKTKSISSLVSKINLSPNINLQLKKKIPKQINFLKNKYKNLILVAPCANWIGKTWPIESFIELLQRLKKDKVFSRSIFIIIGAMNEKKKMRKLIKNKNINILDFVGKIELIEMYYLMQKCNLFIGNDSGLMHLAALAKVPTVGLFGPSDVNKYSPFGSKTLAIKSSKSYNELMGYKGFNPKKVDSLMKSLKVQHVYKKIIQFYKGL